MALKFLFNERLGFECVDTGISNPMIGRFSKYADKYLRYKNIPALYCHSEFLGKKIRESEGFSWERLNLSEIVNNTSYPPPMDIAER